MPRLPRDLGGESLCRKLSAYGYSVSRQTGSHIRLTRATEDGQHHVTVPGHKSLRVDVERS
jgi:predicted RNA binding protein YcfA (HicA-like mRNA interferase family)